MAIGTFIATAYGPPWGGINGGGTTRTGVQLPNAPTGAVGPPYIVAVDPTVIPLHSKLLISPNPAGDDSIVWSAEDTGGAILGNRLDFLDLAGRASQLNWGRRPVTVSKATGANATTTAAQPIINASSSGGTSSTTSDTNQPSDWLKLLLDVAFVGLGAAGVYRGSRRLLAKPS